MVSSYDTHVDFSIFESLFEVVIDGLVGDLADEREITDAHLLLLRALEDCFLHLWPPTTARRLLFGLSIFLAASSSSDALGPIVSWCT